MCVLGVNSGPFMAITAAPPLALELGLLLVVCWSTVARPRTTSEPLLAAFVRAAPYHLLWVSRIVALRGSY
jgi:hypothetical protein